MEMLKSAQGYRAKSNRTQTNEQYNSNKKSNLDINTSVEGLLCVWSEVQLWLENER